MANRSSARLAFLLRIISMAISSVMGFFWTPFFVRVLGDSVYGTFLSFQGVTRLAGLGDFGLSAAVTLRIGQMIGRGEMERLREFLASARTVVLLTAIWIGALCCILAPWLPGWLDFKEVAGAGSLTALFLVGGVTITACLVVGYLNGVNAAYATVTWPILPTLVLGQMALVGQWVLAKLGFPLWVQAAAPLLSICAQGFVIWLMVKVAHPWLGNLWPLRRDPAVWRELFRASGWAYLYSLGNIVFITTDRLLINAGTAPGFGPGAVPGYLFNYKLCEMAIQVIASATIIGQSKVNLWIHSPEEAVRERARAAVQRLLLFESLFGTAAALGYLAINDEFIAFWVGPQYQRPAALQWAFALTLAITLGGNAGIQIANMCGTGGLRVAGSVVGLCALLNLALSFVSMKLGSVLGIAYATVIAQTVASIFLVRFTSRYLGMPLRPWLMRAWVLPVSSVSILAGLRYWIGSDTAKGIACLLLAGALLLLLQTWMAGMTRDFILHEWNILRQMMGGKTS